MSVELAAIVKLAELATKIAIDQNERKANAKLVADFSRVIAENNEILFRGMSSIIGRAFSQEKLDSCNNTLSTLAKFYREFANNPDDLSKISLIETQAGFVLDILNDDDIALVGIRTYLATASIRINALVAKAAFFANDLANAKEEALTSVAYVTRIWPLLVETTMQRIGQPSFTSFIRGVNCRREWDQEGGSRYVCDEHCWAKIEIPLDGSIASTHEVDTGPVDLSGYTFSRIFTPDMARRMKCENMVKRGGTNNIDPAVRQSLIRVANLDRAPLEQQLIRELPLSEMEACATAWQSFSQPNNLVEQGPSLSPLAEFLRDVNLEKFQELYDASWNSLVG
jgi:hypothetical protein